MSRAKWLALIAGVLALLLGGRMVLRYLDWQASEAARSPAAGIDVAELETLAKAACLCTRTKGKAGEAACWQEYKAATALPIAGGYGTACAPVSTETDCFMTAEGETCVVTGYSVNGGTDRTLNRDLCSADEAQAVEGAYRQGWLGPDSKEPDPGNSADWQASDDRANAAVDRVLREIMDGKQVAPAGPVSGGCTG